MIIIRVNKLSQIESELGELKDKAPEVLRNALKEAALKVRDELIDKATKGYTVRPNSIKETITVHNANTRSITAYVESRGTRRPLIDFEVNPKKYDPKNPPNVLKVAVKRNGLKDMRGAFISKGKATGNINVFRRANEKRYPIHIKYGPSVPEILGTENIKKHIESEVAKMLDDIIEKQLDRILGGEL